MEGRIPRKASQKCTKICQRNEGNDEEKEKQEGTASTNQRHKKKNLTRIEIRNVTPGFLKNKTRLIICVPRKSTHMLE
jgi:hypothetical protein